MSLIKQPSDHTVYTIPQNQRQALLLWLDGEYKEVCRKIMSAEIPDLYRLQGTAKVLTEIIACISKPPERTA